jgi:hypothetical protein
MAAKQQLDNKQLVALLPTPVMEMQRLLVPFEFVYGHASARFESMVLQHIRNGLAMGADTEGDDTGDGVATVESEDVMNDVVLWALEQSKRGELVARAKGDSNNADAADMMVSLTKKRAEEASNKVLGRFSFDGEERYRADCEQDRAYVLMQAGKLPRGTNIAHYLSRNVESRRERMRTFKAGNPHHPAVTKCASTVKKKQRKRRRPADSRASRRGRGGKVSRTRRGRRGLKHAVAKASTKAGSYMKKPGSQ